MKNFQLLLIYLFLSTNSISFGQDEKPVNKFKIEDIGFQTIFSLEKVNYGSLSDFNILAPNSVLLKEITSEYYQDNHYYLSLNNQYSVSVGFKLKESQPLKGKSTLRLGINSFSETSLSSDYYKEDVVRYDTLTSSQTGQSIYLDSSISTHINMNYSQKNFRINLAYLYKNSFEKRFSFFAGIGFTVGLTYNAKTEINYNSYIYPSSEYNYDYEHKISKSERIINKNSLGASAYLPIGIDFRIGKNNGFWKRVFLSYELRPTFNYSTRPNLKPMMNTNLQFAMGLRYFWG